MVSKRKSVSASKKKSSAVSAATRKVRIAAGDVISGDRFVLNGQADGVVAGAFNSVSTSGKKVTGHSTCLVIKRRNGDMITKTYGMNDRVLIRETPSMRKVRKNMVKAMNEAVSSN